MNAKEHAERQEEQQRASEIRALILSRISRLQEQLGTVKSEIVTIRKEFWDDVTVNFEDAAEAAETFASMKQQAEVLSERERSHRHARAQQQVLERLKDSPYFGRIDFREAGESAAERIYIGIGSLLDDDGEMFLIYDWRAPVSGMYYDFAPGPAEYETPMGRIEGMMELKRQYIIRGGEIVSLFDTGITIGDELLQQVLGKQSDAQMKSIVATIQREQNQVIRNTTSRLLVVQGAAGSGKTSAALQRVAYLLYRYRETLSAEHILLFSPNPMFNSYVSTVLPELGEDNMQQTTFQEYVEHRVGEAFRVENTFEQLEFALTALDHPYYAARQAGIRFKAGNTFLELMEAYVRSLKQEGIVFKDIRFRDRVLISVSQIRDKFYSCEPSWSIPNRLVDVTEWLQQQLRQFAKAERPAPWVEDEIELLDSEAYLEAYNRLRSQKQFSENTFDDFDREKAALAAMVVNEHFKPLRRWVKRLSFIDLPATYAALFQDIDRAAAMAPEVELPEEWPAICADTAARLSAGELPSEDATAYVLLKDRIEGSHRNLKVRHLFIDEAQDYSPIQLAYLRQLFPMARWTALGDWNQAIHVQAAESDGFGELAALFDKESSQTVLFSKSYRSTRQIVDFTRGMMPNGDTIEPFNRHGGKPTVTLAREAAQMLELIVSKLKELIADGHRTLAVICKTAEESRLVHRHLKDKVPAKLIGMETVTFEQGLVVIPAYLAKGVEFDAVLLYNASKDSYGRESERRLFYTACTRAMHELHLFCLGEISPFIADTPSDTYTFLQAPL
ncbi:DNA helicase-2 / ATP-dependent DNA helicase PcrA [Paenibacillus sp. UNCCL117]|uniref:RNA polymerase recycling motor HelD n=1 Tax=unclassified Paenibacillus TaxID=185978 RepID=UPI0008904291|nr:MULTISPECIES: RNA polymerase recycling motor HelD [unclassified Paenibacillus]SDC89571.1 DNA helicase-2 / ATP-dependent DNA helicase PcrA [Paenibacillus sp. cl123]SFW28585.1 DNA helicase-2 / ATP-dependent DNA helicase PcrA [Paenibacillus sp. UNCCL117]